MNIIKAYYDHILDIFMEVYGKSIESAQPGNCMKVTSLSLDILRDLYARLSLLNTETLFYILTEDPDMTGVEYITPTKLIELRNDLTKSILVLIPVNSSTSAEDSYGNATFRELSISDFDEILYKKLQTQLSGKQAIKEALNYAGKDLDCTLQDKIKYLLYVILNGETDEAIGNGLYLLNLLPDSSLVSKKEYIPQFLVKNDECISVMADYSMAIADRISAIPVKPGTIQQDVAKFLRENNSLINRKDLCAQVLENYPQLNFSNWYSYLKNITELGVLHVTKVELGSKVFHLDGEDIKLKMEPSKGAKVKLRIYFSPKPSAYTELKKVKIAIMNGDGFYKETDVVTKKISENNKDYRDITFSLNNAFENGTYFFHVYAENNDGTELNVSDAFRDEAIQHEWEKVKTSGNISKEEFQQQTRRLLTSDSDTFFLQVVNATDEPEETGTRMKINNVLQAYFRYRIELNRKGQELTTPQRQAINDKSGKTSDDEYKSWQFATHIKTFQLRYDTNNNYQIPLSIKLLELEETILKNSKKLGYIDAIISDNYTDETLKSIILREIDDLQIPESLIEKRVSLFESILNSAPDRTGVIEAYEVFNHIGDIKEYINEYHAWLKSLDEKNISQSLAVLIQSIDTVSLQIEMPDGRIAHTKLLTPLHPIRLGWLVNIYEQYEEWEAKTAEDPRFRKPDVWYKKLDNLFYGDLLQDVAPLVMRDIHNEDYLQYVGELCFGWGFYVNPQQSGDDTFSTGFRQLKAYVSQLLNIGVQYRIDSDVNKQMVYRLIWRYITQHPYTNKLIINIFNAGDAAVFADNLVMLERDTANTPFDIHYEIRMFCDDKRFPQGEALRDLLNPDTQVSEEAENFSQPDDNRLFPKLRFSVNSVDEFTNNPNKYPAHLSFLVNPFPTKASLKRSNTRQQSFFLNGVITRPIIQVEKAEKGYMWHRYISEAPLANPVSNFSNETQELFSTLQWIVANSMTTDHEVSVPSLTLNIIEIQPSVLEVIDGKGLPFLVLYLLTAHTAYRAHSPGIDTAEGGLLVMVIDTVLVHAHLHVLLFSGEHQTGAAVFLRVDVPAAPDREKARIELLRIARIPLQGDQPLAVSQRDLLAVLATAHVHRLPLDPPFGLASHLAGDLLQSLVAVHALIVDHDKIGTVHLPHLPVGNVTHAVIDGLHHHRHMVTGRGGQREQGVGVTVGGLQHQETFDKALDAVQLQVILPFTLAHLLRRVAFRQPVPFTQIVRVVVHVQGHEGIIAERQGKHILSLHFLALRRAVVHSHARTLGSGFVIYR